MQNQSEKTIEEKRLEAQRALEGEERGRKREEEKRKKAEEEQRKKNEVEKKTREKEERIKLKEEEDKNEVEKKLKEEEIEKKALEEEANKKIKKEEEDKKLAKEREKIAQQTLLEQMRPPGKKLRPLSKEFDAQKKDKVKIPRIKTYRNDAREAIKKQGESLTKIVLSEKKKVREKTIPINKEIPTEIKKISASKKTSHKILIIITGFIIISFSGGALIYFYQTNKKENPRIVTENPETVVTITPTAVNTLITTNTEKSIDISKGSTAVLGVIAKELRETSGTGSIKNIYLTETIDTFTEKGVGKVQQISSIKKLLSLWSHKMPALLSRSLSNNFMLGVYSSNPGRNMPFIILTTNSYEQTFAGMFEWENNILNDFYKLFGLGVNETSQSFQDTVIRRNDVRILKDKTGETLLLYSFINKKVLIITTNEEAFNKILLRLK